MTPSILSIFAPDEETLIERLAQLLIASSLVTALALSPLCRMRSAELFPYGRFATERSMRVRNKKIIMDLQNFSRFLSRA